MSQFEQRILASTPVRRSIQGGHEINYITKSVMGNFFGYALDGRVFIREGLSNRVERFVISHEKYHLKDGRNWLGWVGSEARANIYCGIRDPIGLVATILASVKNRRLPLYWQMMKSGGKKPS